MDRLPIFLLFACCYMIVAGAEKGDGAGAYEVLKGYGFPAGILPKGASGYDLDEKTGTFDAYFNGSCSFSLEGSYQLRYSSRVRGHISHGRLSQLTGVSVKVFFLWLNIVEVSISGDELFFSVGIASAEFPIDNFELIPQCGCGLNCNGVRLEKRIYSRPELVSSI